METTGAISKKTCVYMHINKENGKRYVGITCQGIEQRWRNGGGYRYGIFANAIKKYGWDAFEHVVLYENLSYEEAKAKEAELINVYRSDDMRYGYNMTKGGDGTVGYTHTEASRAKMSKTRIERGTNKGKNNPMYGKSGELAPHFGVSVSETAKIKMSKAAIDRHEQWRKIGYHPEAKAVISVDSLGHKEYYFSAAEAERQTGARATSIIRCCRGQKKTYYKKLWYYAEYVTEENAGEINASVARLRNGLEEEEKKRKDPAVMAYRKAKREAYARRKGSV